MAFRRVPNLDILECDACGARGTAEQFERYVHLCPASDLQQLAVATRDGDRKLQRGIDKCLARIDEQGASYHRRVAQLEAEHKALLEDQVRLAAELRALKTHYVTVPNRALTSKELTEMGPCAAVMVSADRMFGPQPRQPRHEDGPGIARLAPPRPVNSIAWLDEDLLCGDAD